MKPALLITLLLWLGAAGAEQKLFQLEGGDYAALADPGQQWSIEQLSQPPLADKFKLRAISPGFGVDADGHWLRFKLPSAWPVNDTRLLSTFGAYRRVCLYWPRPAGVFAEDCRDWPADDPAAEFKGPGVIFRPPSDFAPDREVYIYADSVLWLVVPVVYGTTDAVMSWLADSQTFYGLFYGTLFGVAVLSMALARQRRDWLFLWLGGVLLAIAVFLASFENHLAALGWHGFWTAHFVLPLIMLSVVMGSHLLRVFLELPTFLPRDNRRLLLASWLALAIIPVYWLATDIGIALLAIVLLVWPPMMLWSAAKRLRQGFKPAGYALISVLMLMLAAVAGGLEALGYQLADPAWLSLSRYYGVLLLTGCLLLGIIDRVSTLARERDAARQLAESAQQLALRRAQYDNATGLANRDRLQQELQEQMALAREGGHALLLVCCAVQRYRRLVRSVEPAQIDELAVELARRLSTHLNRAPARTGPGEYAWWLVGEEASLASAERDCEKLRRALAEPLSMAGGHRPAVGFGVACFPEHGAEARRLLQAGEVALGRAMRGEGRGFVAYQPDMLRSERQVIRTLAHFEEALAAGELAMYFQPFLNLRTGAVQGAEALLRWPKAEGGFHNNEAFMPLVEQSEDLPLFTRWTVETVCAQIANWAECGLNLPYVTMNIASAQLQSAEFSPALAEAMRAHAIRGEQLAVEVTEGALLEDLPAAQAKLQSLRETGIRIAVDDFGVGYSSLSYLRQLPLDVLKIDRSFLSGVPDDPAAGAVFDGIASLAQALGLVIVSEGVENHAQAEFLRRRGVNMAQGFHYARPMSADKFLTWHGEQRA